MLPSWLPPTLMAVLAHPDDESLGTGGALAKYAAEGVATYLVTATRGERGRFGDSKISPGPEIVGKTREAELLSAAAELGLREVKFLDYLDGALDKVDKITWFQVQSENFESIHNHNAYAFIEKDKR